MNGSTPAKRAPSIDDVRAFWNANPLWQGEAAVESGSPEFFASHRQASLAMTGGSIPDWMLPKVGPHEPLLDLGCGVGFWLEEFWRLGFRNITGADLSIESLRLASRRCELLGADVTLSEQNAQAMTFADGQFRHVNCIGVIHHSPSPQESIAEIARVLAPGGTAVISVYFWNMALRAWPALRAAVAPLARFGIGLRGRGREGMLEQKDAREIVRLYDGSHNPVGYAYSEKQFRQMLEPHFIIEQTKGYVFPLRVLDVSLPLPIFRLLEKACPFMIGAMVRKPPTK